MKIINTLLLFVVAAISFFSSSAQKAEKMIAAHRGLHNDFPENSIAAINKTIEEGIDILELDIRRSSDGVLVLMHDKTVDRTTNGKGAIEQMSFAEIRELRLMHKGKVTDESVPTLEEALILASGKTLIDLDIKTAGSADEIIRLVEKTGTQKSVLFFVYNAAQVNALKRRNPDFKVMARTRDADGVRKLLADCQPDIIHIDASHHTEDVVALIHAHKVKVWINALGAIDRKVAAGNVSAFEEALKHGADIVQTDYPVELKKYLISIEK